MQKTAKPKSPSVTEQLRAAKAEIKALKATIDQEKEAALLVKEANEAQFRVMQNHIVDLKDANAELIKERQSISAMVGEWSSRCRRIEAWHDSYAAKCERLQLRVGQAEDAMHQALSATTFPWRWLFSIFRSKPGTVWVERQDRIAEVPGMDMTLIPGDSNGQV